MKKFMDKAYEMPMAEKGETITPEQLVKTHLRLVIGIARKKYFDSPYFEDIVQDGNLSLWKAAQKFDASLGYTFATYAMPIVTMAMMNSNITHNSHISVLTTKSLRKAYFNINKYRSPGKRLTDEQCLQMSKDLDIKVEDIREVESRLKSKFETTVYVPNESDGELDDIFSMIEDMSLEPSSILENLERYNLITNKFDKAIDKLTDKEQYIVRARYMEEKPKTFAVLAKEFSVSGQAIDQAARLAMKKIREELIHDYC